MLIRLFCLFLPLLIQATPFWTSLPDPVTGTTTATIAMNTSPSGNLIVGWVDTMGVIQSSLYDSNTSTWSTPIVISTATAAFSNLSIAINDAGDCAAAWIDATDSVIQCCYKENGSANWGSVYTESTGMVVYPVYYPPNITIDSNGIAVVAWTQSGSGSNAGQGECYVFAVACVSGTWNGMGNPILSSNRARFNTSMFFSAPQYPGVVLGNPEGNVIVLWSGGFEMPSDSFELLYALRNNDGTWTSPVVLTVASGNAGGGISGAITSTALSATANNQVGFTTSNLQPAMSGDWTNESFSFPTAGGAVFMASATGMNAAGWRTVVGFNHDGSGGSIYASSSAPSSNTWSAYQKLNTGFYPTFAPVSAVVDSKNLSIAAWYDGTNIEYSYAEELNSWIAAETLSASASKQHLATTNTGLTYIAWATSDNTLKVSVHNDPVLPPETFTGERLIYNFGVQQELIHRLSWSASEQAVSYSIYGDEALTDLVASTSNLTLDLHNRDPDQVYTYYIVSVDSLGAQSVEVPLTIYPYN